MIDYDALAEEPIAAPTDAEIKTVALLAEKQCKLEDEVEELKAGLKKKEAELRKVSWEEVPEAMLRIGCTSFTLNDGSSISISDKPRASITKANQSWCFSWLYDSGNGDIIKNEFKTVYGVGEDSKADALAIYLDELEQPYNQKKFIHPGTLNAFCTAELEDSEPADEWKTKFGIFEQKIAKITRP